MSEPENFVARWSRRKREADKTHARETTVENGTDPETHARQPGEPPSADIPAFDPASLPQIESITAATDLKVFLAPGVPQELAKAALRRAWSLDPNIRDFVGPADYAWDYHADTPGFRSLELTEEIRREVLRMINHAADDLPVPSSDDTDHLPTLPNEAQSGTPPLSHEISAQMPATTPSKLAAPSHDTSAAPEPRRSESIRSAPTRSHGGALPD